jgi:hypothetical protein
MSMIFNNLMPLIKEIGQRFDQFFSFGIIRAQLSICVPYPYLDSIYLFVPELLKLAQDGSHIGRAEVFEKRQRFLARSVKLF